MHSRRALGAAIVAVAAPIALSGTPTYAATCGDGSHITAWASDRTPASGQRFITRGRLVMDGMPAADHIVKVQAWRNGEWQRLTGARVRTTDEGKYRMRLVLFQRGERLLRAVGIGEGHESNQRQAFTVVVH